MTRPWRAGHLFAGIDGFGLGLAAAGIDTAWTAELDPYCDEVLALRLPGVERFRDVRELTGPPAVQIVTGGFPCQDLSNAGLGAGITGARSGLYSELVRIVADVNPELVLIENVPALLHRGMELVVRDLVALGYGIEWDCLPAAAFGAPHLRDRIWIVAHRAGAPSVFGQPATLFALEPELGAELVGGDDDEDEEPRNGWQRWPRAGWVDGDPGLVMPLEPLARAGDVKRGRVLLPTPAASPAGWEHLDVVDKDGNPPAHPHQRFYHPDTGRIVQKDLRHALAYYDGKPLPDLPTPLAADGVRRNLRNYGRSRTLLGAANGLALMPTPTASDHKGPGPLDRRPVGDDNLATRVARLLPTPQASDGAGGRIDRGEGPTRDSGAKRSVSLATAVDREKRITSGALNPVWVEWLMGFPLGWTDLETPNDELVVAPWELGEPDGVPRVSDNCPNRRQRLTALGNALVPQAPAWIAERATSLLTR